MTATVAIAGLVGEVSKVDPAREWPGGTFDYVDIAAVDQASKAIVQPQRVDSKDAPSRARQLVRAGDVLVSTVRPNLNAVALVPAHLDGAVASTGFTVLRPSEGVVDSRYLFHWVRTPSFIGAMTRRATGASYPAVSDRIVKASEVPLPPIEVQKRIAAVLDQADELRAKRQTSLDLIHSLDESIFLDIFGDPAANKQGFRTAALGDIALKFSDGPFGSNLKSSHYVESGVRVVRLQNIGVGRFVDDDAAYISEDHFTALRKHGCRPGDVLVATLGDPNLRACMQPTWLRRALNKADCVQIRVDPEQATAQWLTALLNLPSTARLAQGLVLGQTRARISMGRLRTLVVPVPPLDMQCLFGETIVAIEGQSRSMCRSSSELDDLFVSLQQRAFAGQL